VFETEDADNKSHTAQVIGLLSLLVELQAGSVTAPERDIPATASGSSQSHITDEVLALVDSVPKMAGKILNVQSIIDPTAVRTPTLIHYHLHPRLY